MTSGNKTMAQISRRGKVFVIKDRCKGCGLCISMCPTGVLKLSKDINREGYHYPEVHEEPPKKVCVNCGTCMLICPDSAIYTKPYKNNEHNNQKIKIAVSRPTS